MNMARLYLQELICCFLVSPLPLHTLTGIGQPRVTTQRRETKTPGRKLWTLYPSRPYMRFWLGEMGKRARGTRFGKMRRGEFQPVKVDWIQNSMSLPPSQHSSILPVLFACGPLTLQCSYTPESLLLWTPCDMVAVLCCISFPMQGEKNQLKISLCPGLEWILSPTVCVGHSYVLDSVTVVVVQLLSCVQLFATP